MPAGGLESELIGEEVMSEEVMLPVSVEADMPLSVVAMPGGDEQDAMVQHAVNEATGRKAKKRAK